MEKTKNTKLNVNKSSNPKPCAGSTPTASAVTPSLTGLLISYGTLAVVMAEPTIPIMNFGFLNQLLFINIYKNYKIIHYEIIHYEIIHYKIIHYEIIHYGSYNSYDSSLFF